MKKAIPFDTSALISLGHSGLIDEILEVYCPIVTPSVLTELKEVARRDDSDGRSAKEWLKRRRGLRVEDVKRQIPTENELYHISRKERLPLITDDIRAVRRFRGKVDCLFSVHIIYVLYLREAITKEQGLLAIENMKGERSWKENAIAIAGRVLFEG